MRRLRCPTLAHLLQVAQYRVPRRSDDWGDGPSGHPLIGVRGTQSRVLFGFFRDRREKGVNLADALGMSMMDIRQVRNFYAGAVVDRIRDEDGQGAVTGYTGGLAFGPMPIFPQTDRLELRKHD